MKKRGPERDKDMEDIVLFLRDIENMTFEEIGTQFGFSKQRAHSIYKRYRKEIELRMKEKIEE